MSTRALTAALCLLAACDLGGDDGPAGLRLTAVRVGGAGCTVVDPLVIEVSGFRTSSPTAAHDGRSATCSEVIEDDGEWQTGCTYVADGPDRYVEYIRIATDYSGGVVLPYLGTPACVDEYTITLIEQEPGT